ncbi:esterase-like activity of phytase family protein [Dokdonia sinensis]|nr:esterase-like activity of phytase family protein [Dokdonia sinensis]
MKKIYSILMTAGFVCVSCGSRMSTTKQSSDITALNYIAEIIIPQGFIFEGEEVGGLSAIDYANGSWYVLSDDRKSPRYYSLGLNYNTNGFENPKILGVAALKSKNNLPFKSGLADPESLRVSGANELYWSSEGNISTGIHPFIYRASRDGTYIAEIKLPNRYLAGQDAKNGPRNNGVFEALSLDYNSNNLWVTTELPLVQDGEIPTSKSATSPVRIANINVAKNTFESEYVYMLDKVARPGKMEVNGITEILSYSKNRLLILERSYASGHSDGGNNVKIYKVDISGATDVSKINNLSNTDFTPVEKTLLFDFNTIRAQLPSGRVDNIEGMTFGPLLENGKKSLVVISDNNFNNFGEQVTQLILFEVE